MKVKLNIKPMYQINNKTLLNHSIKAFCKRINESSISELISTDKNDQENLYNFSLKSKALKNASILVLSIFSISFLRYEMYFMGLFCGSMAIYKYIKQNSSMNVFLNQLDENFTEIKNKQINFAVK
jgi:hypothetical protein